MAASIVAAVATLLAIVWFLIQRGANRNAKLEEAKRDAQKAIDSGDTAALADAQRRMQLYS